ncbi:hypothetical protein MTO96_022337 [Rhipicephalus appendiculatus]
MLLHTQSVWTPRPTTTTKGRLEELVHLVLKRLHRVSLLDGGGRHSLQRLPGRQESPRAGQLPASGRQRRSSLVKMIVNLTCLFRGSSRIIDFYAQSAAFERRIGMPSCECCAPRCYFWSDVRRACLCVFYCAAFGFTVFLSPRATESTLGRGNDNGWIHASFWISFVVTSVFYFAYDNVHTVALRSSCQTLSPGRDDDVPARLESVRLNLCEIQRLKNAINDVWNWSLVVNGVFVLLLLCTAVYDLCTDGLGGRENYGSWFYAAYTTYEFVSLTFLSQSLSNMGKKIQDACKMTRSVDNDRYRHQMQCLRDSVDSEDLSLRAGDFFKLKVSLLVSVGVNNFQ